MKCNEASNNIRNINSHWFDTEYIAMQNQIKTNIQQQIECFKHPKDFKECLKTNMSNGMQVHPTTDIWTQMNAHRHTDQLLFEPWNKKKCHKQDMKGN